MDSVYQIILADVMKDGSDDIAIKETNIKGANQSFSDESSI